MKTKHCLFCLLTAALCLRALGQQYSIDWFKISGGGGTSTGGVYAASGTIGQPEAGTMAGGNYSLTGGFWGLISAVSTPGAPTLFVAYSGNTVTIYWQAVSGWSLAQKNSLAPSVTWSASSGLTTSNGTNYLSVANPSGSMFYKLQRQ